ncbi:thyrotropin-releasing hormone-degrading ectoenzyme-like [Ornithodoros turicata]|uniref:thyrotropin-releasing hormone-degrading ectoenzyme-like n=1 Tax=Ornithodoros turicata TaxID=34597 RepID=UPI003139758E
MARSSPSRRRSFLYDNRYLIVVTALPGTIFSSLFIVLLYISTNRQRISALPLRRDATEGASIPTHYDIQLQTSPELFRGRVNIQLLVQEGTKDISLHSRGLTLSNVQVIAHEGEVILPKVTFNHTLHTTTLQLQRPLKKFGTYNVTMDFEGVFQIEPKGLYLDATGDYHTVISFMEPKHARLVFPCFDYPAVRSTFTVTIVKPNSSYTAISNSKVRSELIRPDGTVLSVFKKTSPIPTHLVAVVLTNLPIMKIDFMSVWMRPDLRGQLEHVFLFLKACIHKAIHILGSSIPLSHLNIVVVDEYPCESHMSWGLLALRSDVFLHSRGSCSMLSALLRVTQEVLRAWFGGTVSAHSWDMAWFNDGLSLLYAFKVLGTLKPEWPLHALFGICLHGHMAEYNATAILHRELLWETTSQLQRRACMAAARLAMIRRAMGPSSFRQAVAIFLKKFKYRTATDDDFWSALNPKFDLLAWSTLPGYPYVSVRRLNSTRIHLEQKPFFDSPPSGRLWVIPLTATYANKHLARDDLLIWMTEKTIEVDIPGATSGDWILINIGHEGVYRVDYEDTNWELLSRQLKRNLHEIGAQNRAQILDDLFFLAFQGYRSMEQFYAILPYLQHEDDVLPWVVYTFLVEKFEAVRGSLPARWKDLDRFLCSAAPSKFSGDAGSTSPESAFKTHILRHCCAQGCRSTGHDASKCTTMIGYPQHARHATS